MQVHTHTVLSTCEPGHASFHPFTEQTITDEILIATGGPGLTGLHQVPGWEPLQLQLLLSRAGCYPESGFWGS